MKHLLYLLAFIVCAGTSHAQITISNSDMPASGDTLRYTNVNVLGTTLAPATDTGAGVLWSYDLTGISQGIDTYKTAVQVNPAYALSVPLSASGIKVADSIPGLSLIAAGITLNDIYTFYDHLTSPNSYAAVAFAGSLSGFPLAAAYTDPDILFEFPLAYGNTDSNSFAFHFGLASAGSVKRMGWRKVHADGWGTIATPYYTTPASCLRVRSEIFEVDSITFSGNSFGLPRTTVEYKWLVNGEHYPALFITTSVFGGAEIVTQARYRDAYRADLNNTNAVATVHAGLQAIQAYPNPAPAGLVHLTIPASWGAYTVEVFDTRSAQVYAIRNSADLHLETLPSGMYVARISSQSGAMGYVGITK